jgi:hypothetical protein
MVGTQRSGSNLLRVMLDSIDRIVAPHPPHILERFMPLLPKYGDLADNRNFHRLAEDVCELVNVNPVPWDGVETQVDRIIPGCRQHSLQELFRVIYESAATQTNASFWMCKSMKNMFYSRAIESTGIRPYYIYLYRDGREVALSFKKAIVGEKHIYALAQSWKKDQEAVFRLRGRTEPERFFMISYESLTAQPEASLQRLCRFLHIPYSDQAMEFYKSRESANTAIGGKMWMNVTKPVMKDNTQKFLSELSYEDVAIFESVAGDMLQKLGYPLYTAAEAYKRGFRPEEVSFYAHENMRLKKAFMQQADKDDVEKRLPQKELIDRIIIN